jgi:hypothetical protein
LTADNPHRNMMLPLNLTPALQVSDLELLVTVFNPGTRVPAP